LPLHKLNSHIQWYRTTVEPLYVGAAVRYSGTFLLKSL